MFNCTIGNTFKVTIWHCWTISNQNYFIIVLGFFELFLMFKETTDRAVHPNTAKFLRSAIKDEKKGFVVNFSPASVHKEESFIYK